MAALLLNKKQIVKDVQIDGLQSKTVGQGECMNFCFRKIKIYAILAVLTKLQEKCISPVNKITESFDIYCEYSTIKVVPYQEICTVQLK